MEVGKLYRCEEYFLMLYPDQDTAADAQGAASYAAGFAADHAGDHAAASAAAYLSNRLGKPVSYVEKNVPLLVLNDKK